MKEGGCGGDSLERGGKRSKEECLAPIDSGRISWIDLHFQDGTTYLGQSIKPSLVDVLIILLRTCPIFSISWKLSHPLLFAWLIWILDAFLFDLQGDCPFIFCLVFFPVIHQHLKFEERSTNEQPFNSFSLTVLFC